MKTMPLSQGKIALVDDSDVAFLSQTKWCVSNRYAAGWWKGRMEYMHRVLLPEADEVDHVDGDPLNNQRYNLRSVTHGQNMHNFRKPTAYGGRALSSRFKGVCWARTGWQAQIAFQKKHIYIGKFASETDAARAYNEAALRYFGEYARLNEITESV